MEISSRTPEGTPNVCPVCGGRLAIEPSDPAGDAPCPRCGHLLWFSSEVEDGWQVIRPGENFFQPSRLEALYQSITTKKRIRLIIDMNDVEHLPRMAMFCLAEFNDKLVRLSRGRLRLRGVRPELREGFGKAGLDTQFHNRLL